jgi:hypothetical protein
MLVKVVSVTREDVPNKNGKGSYGKLTVAYRNDQGKLAEKPLLSFTNPAVFKAFEHAEAGAEINVKSEKVGDYWNWTAILSGDEATSQAPVANTATTTATRVTGSTYETKEERAVKQKYIVKQSSISAAVAILTVGAKTPPTPEAVIALADTFVEYVFDDGSKTLSQNVSIQDMEDDIPY